MDDAPTIRDSDTGPSAEDGPIDVPAHHLLRVIGEGSYGRIWLAINARSEERRVGKEC